MATCVRIPRVGHAIDTILIGSWRKAEGEKVTKGDVLFEVEGEKASQEVEAPISGVLLRCLAAEGRVVPVLSVAAIIGAKDEALPPWDGPHPHAAPDVAELAHDLGLDLATIPGSGSDGEVTVKDVRRADDERPRAMTQIRQAISRRLSHSKHRTPHFYLTVSVDMTDLIAYRKVLRRHKTSLSLNDFIIRATALALREFPRANSKTEDGTHIHHCANINIGIAVNIDDGVVVPVVHHADRLTLSEIHQLVRNLVSRTEQGGLCLSDMLDGTFTVSNMGMFNVDEFTAIINPGEGGILAIGSPIPKPVANAAREVVVRDMMRITLSADHRVIDGALAGIFTNAIRRHLQDMKLWQRETGVPFE